MAWFSVERVGAGVVAEVCKKLENNAIEGLSYDLQKLVSRVVAVCFIEICAISRKKISVTWRKSYSIDLSEWRKASGIKENTPCSYLVLFAYALTQPKANLVVHRWLHQSCCLLSAILYFVCCFVRVHAQLFLGRTKIVLRGTPHKIIDRIS